jgi:formylglycine-generating enzyme required for sulfatase activity
MKFFTGIFFIKNSGVFMNRFSVLILSAVFLALTGTIFLQSQSEGRKVGIVNSIDFNKGEVIISTPGSANIINMGDLLYIKIDGRYVLLRAVFPMMTITKCRAEGQNAYLWIKIVKGLPVYRYEAGIENFNASGEQPGATKIFGGIEMVYIPAGEFALGSSDNDKESAADEKPQHKVKISSFYFGKYEVTQKQYVDIIGNNPSAFKENPDNPVEQVSWDDAVAFCNKLSIKTGLRPYYSIINNVVTINTTSNGFRLPTEAEWEYAARAGTNTLFFWGDKKNWDYAWYEFNSDSITHPFGKKKPNPFGLYDISGNVSEWCYDLYEENFYKNSPVLNPINSLSGATRVIRGGSRYSSTAKLRSSARAYYYQDSSSNVIGFRIAKSN